MGDTLKSFTYNMTELLGQAHESIVSALLTGNTGEAAGLLEDCQEGAVALGTKIEEVKKTSDVISVLEQYCETLYILHEKLLENGITDIKAFGDTLSKNLHVIQESVRKNILERKTVVFLPYKASMWDSLESVWKAADADPDCDAYVVPIPYYEKKSDGMLGEMYYEGDQYPEYVPITDYNNFNFGMHHPDMIFIHNPYDAYNYVTSVHPFFYSGNIKKFTDNLVYIPYFVLDEVEPGDREMVNEISYFCTAPAVINADTVIVQSEKMRQVYIRALTKTLGEKTTDRWEKKILGLGSPKYDKVLEETENMEMPEEWKKIIYDENGIKRKIVFYNNGLGALLQSKEAILDKIEKVLQAFKKNRDEVVFWWRPHPLMKPTIQSMNPGMWERYERIVETYQKESWGIYDDTADLDRAVKLSDAYYGDPSSVIQLFRRAGKPAVVQEVAKE